MRYSRFVVDETPYCTWGWDLDERNQRFLKNIDPGYFEFIARSQIPQLDTDDAKYAALVLRNSYHHSLETLFAFTCAALQAPDCVVGWVQKYQPKQLRSMVERITYGSSPPLNKLRMEKVTWATLSEAIHGPLWGQNSDTVQAFARLWSRFAADFLNPMHEREYNNVKHGFRAGLGGFVLRVGLEHEYGVAPPEAEMQTIGASEHGTSFFVAEKIAGSKVHFSLRQHSLNWRPEAMVQAVGLASMSLNNVLSFLKQLNGVPGSETHYQRPQDPQGFNAPWTWSTGVHEMSFDTPVTEQDIKLLTKDDILAVYEDKPSATGNAST